MKINKQTEFSKWNWTIFLIGGLFMIYGGLLDILVNFEKTLPFAPPSWHQVNPTISLLSGITILLLAVFLILKSFRIKAVLMIGEKDKIKPLMNLLGIVCLAGTIIDLVAGYYARGFLVGLLGVMYLNYKLERKKQYLYYSSIVMAIIIIGFIWTGGK